MHTLDRSSYLHEFGVRTIELSPMPMPGNSLKLGDSLLISV